jgi:SAM-dependent methyltransferase
MQADQSNRSKLYRTLRAWAGRLWQLRSGRLRSEWLSRLRYGDDHFQGPTHTFSDRFPALFEQCRESLQDVRSPLLLSFGCATGEEVFSLAKYLPNATIVGVDINRWCLRQCARRNTNSHLRFLHRHSDEFKLIDGFDAIFCMAVFQRAENRSPASDGVAHGFTFASFEREVLLLDRKLKPGGLLFLDHCDFRFEDTAVSAHYDALPCPANLRLRKRALFGKHNQLMAEEHVSNRIFTKR